MDAAFLQLYCPSQHTVLGRRLRPPCLFDILGLEIAENPAAQLIATRERPATAEAISPQDLLQAVEILHNPIRAALQPGFYKSITPERLEELARLPFAEHCQAFDAYLAETCPIPETWDGDNQQLPGAPWIFAIALKLEMKLPTRTEEQIWTMPLGKLFWTAYTIAELEGATEILSEEIAAVVREIQTMREEEKTHGQD